MIMDANAFTVEIEEKKFLFEKVRSENESFFFYVLPYDKNEKGFFMAKDEDGHWKVLNKFIVSTKVIQMENILAELIEHEINR